MGPVEMLLGGLPNHQTTATNTTTMSKKRHTKEAQIKAIRDHESGRSSAKRRRHVRGNRSILVF